MTVIKSIFLAAALALFAGAASAATIKFEIRAVVSHVTANVEADVDSGDRMVVRGAIDTHSLMRSRIENRLRFRDAFDIDINGPVFGGHDDFRVSLIEVRDNESGIEGDLFRLIIDFQNGPRVNDADYGRVRLSFYIPMAHDTFNAATFVAMEEAFYPDLTPGANGRTAVMNGAFRFPESEDDRNAGFRGEVTSLRLAPVPLPASGLFLLVLMVGAGAASRLRRAG